MSGNDYFIGKDIGRLQAQVACLQSESRWGSLSQSVRLNDLSDIQRENLSKLSAAGAEIRREFNSVIEKFGLELQISEFGLVSNTGGVALAEPICACCPGLGPGNAKYRCCYKSGCDPCDVSISNPDHTQGPS